MSKNEKETEDLEILEADEKVTTKYERKVQKRKEKEEQDSKERLFYIILAAVVVVAVVGVIASFPIRTYLAVNQNFVTINGEKVTKLEFDYNYNLSKNNYINQYGSYLSYFGLDTSKDLSTQMYTETLTWEDFFQQMAVESIQKNKALKAQADAAGFEYDPTEEFKEYEASMKELAEEQSMSLNSYIKAMFGSHATLDRLSEYIKESMIINAYYEQLTEEKAPGDEEITSYYEQNKASYDSVDYYLAIVDAQLPEAAQSTEGAASEPSEAEITEAMMQAKVKAGELAANITEEGELQENQSIGAVNSLVQEWLFDENRKAGDATIIEDSANYRYFAVSFVKRYLNETPSVDVRVVISAQTDGQTILDDWQKGEATEESFIALCSKYSEDTATKDEGGLYEAVVGSGMEDVMADWLYAPERAKGDVTAVTTSDGTHYVMYYLGQNEPAWKLNIKSVLLSQTMTEYLEQIVQDMEVVDSKGNLNYLKIEAFEEAAASTEEVASTQAAE